MRGLTAAALGAIALLWVTPVFADEWAAVRLRGIVLELVGGEWQRLDRGDIVPDDRVIRTVQGSVTLVRGEEMIELGPNTQIQIFDEEGRRPYTTVKQYFGNVQIEAEVQDVQHFSVETPFLVAAVKGTRFMVSSDLSTSKVRVMRGAVSVEGTLSGTQTLVVAGQSALAREDDALVVAGSGKLPKVVDKQGGGPIQTGDVPDENDGQGNGNSNSGNGNGNSGNGNGNSGNGNGNGRGKSGNGNGQGNGNGDSGNGSSLI